MAISNLLPAGGANDNRPNIKQFFGKNPAVANDNVERVSSGMFTNTFVDSVVTTLHSLIEEIAKITDIAKSVVASFGAIVKSIKALNKDVTNRFRVLNNELNASKIDFIRTVLAIPKMEAVPKIEGVPVNINAPETPKKEEGKGFDFGDLLASYLGVKAGGAALKTALSGFVSLLMSPAGLVFLTVAGGTGLILWGLSEMTKAIMESPEWKKFIEGRGYNPDGTKKTDVQLREEAAKDIRSRNDPQGRQQRYKNREDAFKNNSWGEDGKPIKIGQVEGWFNPPNSTDEIWTLKEKLKDGTKYINISTGEKYLDTSIEKGVFKTVPTPGAAPAPVAPAGAPVQAAAPQAAAPSALGQTAAGSFGLGGVTGMGAPSAPAGAPVGEVKKESNTEAPPPSGRPSLKAAIAAAIPVPPAGPSGGGVSAGGGVAVVKNSSVQNVGTTGGAETSGMSGQNLPMFARNDKLQAIFGMQPLKAHQ
jgi:hypothetical protein